MKQILICMALVFVTTMLCAQNIGIGTSSPAYKLDVVGRLRLQNTAQSAGIWFDGTTAPTRSFIGTLNNDHVGIFGAGSSWQFVMNVNTGDVGIGTTAPTANLDVNGTMRFRGGAFPNQPKPGATLQSLDESGNVEWQRPVNFKTNGMAGDVTLASTTWTKVVFNSSNLEVNEGFYYDPFSSVFNAPVKGFYHFDASVYALSSVVEGYMRLVVVRNGNLVKEYRSQRHLNVNNFASGEIVNYVENPSKIKYVSFMLAVSIPLEKNDQVWMECYRSEYCGETTTCANTASVFRIKGDASGTWFSGFLVNRL